MIPSSNIFLPMQNLGYLMNHYFVQYLCLIRHQLLNNFMLLNSFYSPWKRYIIFGFLMFSRDIKRMLTYSMLLVSFLYPLKTSEKLRFSDLFRGYRKRAVAWNWVNPVILFISNFYQYTSETYSSNLRN